MTACALPRFMFTWVPSGNVRLTPESMSQDSDRGAGLSVAIGRNRLPESSDKGGIGSPMPSCRQSRRRFLASFTDSPLFSIHRFILPCLTLHLFRKEVRVAVGLWDSSFKNAFHTLSYRFAAVILVILYSCGKGKELKDAEQGCIADTLTKKQGKASWIPQNTHLFRVRDCICGVKKNREKRVGFPQMRTILGSETASAGAKNRVSAVAIAPFAHGEKGFHEMERLRGPLR